MIVVSDTSPLNYLVLIEQVQVLPMLFGRVVVPPAVMTELQHAGAPDAVRAWAASPPAWLEIQPPARMEPLLGLGAGEAQAIRLAQELHADAVLIDERRAATIIAFRRTFAPPLVSPLASAIRSIDVTYGMFRLSSRAVSSCSNCWFKSSRSCIIPSIKRVISRTSSAL
jgi:hypothetical protein